MISLQRSAHCQVKEDAIYGWQLVMTDDRAMSIQYTRGSMGLKFTCYIVYVEVILYKK